MNKKQNILFKNTAMLYILTFSNYLFSFITVPFQTRIFGPEVYGRIGFASAIMVYVQLVLDFGFILSSTEDVSRSRDDKKEMSRIMSSVFYCKIMLGIISFAILTMLCLVVDRFKGDMVLFQLFFLSTFVNCLLPDFLYRGMEKMTPLTVRAVLMRLFFTVAIFIFLRNSQQVYLIPILNTLGAVGACIWTYYDVYKNCDIKFVKCDIKYILKTFWRSSSYFASRIASTVYSSTNTMIIGFLYPVGNMLGYYTSAEKLMTTARSALSPIADSLYPYMVKNKDYKMVKKILLILLPIIFLGCAVVFIFAPQFCSILFGKEYFFCGKYLRLLMPIIVITLPTYIFGFPMLSPLGLGKFANYSVIIAAIFHGVVLIGLYFAGMLTVENICITTCITEGIVLAVRVLALVFRHKLIKKTTL